MNRSVEMLKQLQMGMRAFLLMASRVWTCVFFLLKKQIRAVRRCFAPLLAFFSLQNSCDITTFRCSVGFPIKYIYYLTFLYLQNVFAGSSDCFSRSCCEDTAYSTIDHCYKIFHPVVILLFYM